MTSSTKWLSLGDWKETRDSLHAYSKVVGAPPRVLADPHPKWWHVSLKVKKDGLYTDPIRHEALGDSELQIALNMRAHLLDLVIDGKTQTSFDLTAGDTATALGKKLEQALHDLGLSIELPEDKYADDQPRSYDPQIAESYLSVAYEVDKVMKTLRDQLDGERSPVQLWPHHFDLAFEWYGTKVVTYAEEGEQTEYPAQLNFGFAPGDSSHADPYFYSNPWPFAERLIDETLPHGARWFTEGFEGTLLPYKTLVDDPEAGSKLLDYYRKVFQVAKPTLIA